MLKPLRGTSKDVQSKTQVQQNKTNKINSPLYFKVYMSLSEFKEKEEKEEEQEEEQEQDDEGEEGEVREEEKDEDPHHHQTKIPEGMQAMAQRE